ncbi:MAG: M56 family metallopeptidase [Phycisphaerales bacterium]
MNTVVEILNAVGRRFVEFSLPMLIQAGALIVILLVVDAVLRRRVRAVFRYWIWMLVLVKLVLPPSLGSPVSVGTWFGEALDVPAASLLEPESPATTESEAGGLSPVISSILSQPDPMIAQPLAAPPATTRPTMATGTAETQPPVETPVVSLSRQGLLLVIWAAVVSALTLLLVQRAFFVRGLLAQSEAASRDMMRELEECRRRLNLRRRVDLRLSPNATSPAVCGLLRPVILIPQSIAPRLQSHDLQAVLLHELAHVKRGDLWINLVQTLLQIAYFYNPLLWLANAMIRRTREQAVDETVLVAMGETARQYPEILVNIAKLAFTRRPTLSLRLIGVVESKSALTARIKHILTRPLPKTAKLGLFSLLVILGSASVLLPMAGPKSATDSVSVREVMLPDVENKLMMLDLATGALLPLPKAESPDEIWRAIGKLGRGDLVYDSNALILVRDAASDQAHAGPTPPFKTYEIKPPLPAVLTVTTAEEVRFEVTILAADEKGCTLKYSSIPADRGAGGGASVEPEKKNGESEPRTAAKLPAGVTVEFLGLHDCGSQEETWWRPDGEALPEAPYGYSSYLRSTKPNDTYEVLFRIGSPAGGTFAKMEWTSGRSSIPGVLHRDGGRRSRALPDGAGDLFIGALHPGPGASLKRIDVGVGLDNAWEPLGVLDGQASQAVTVPDAVIKPAREEEGKTVGTVTHRISDREVRLVAVDKNGSVHEPVGCRIEQGGGIATCEPRFELPLAEINQFRLETQKLTWLAFKDVSLIAGQRTEFRTVLPAGGGESTNKTEPVAPATGSPSDAAGATGPVVKLPNGAAVELVGIRDSAGGDGSWWRPDGEAMSVAPYDSSGGIRGGTPKRMYEALVRIDAAGGKPFAEMKWSDGSKLVPTLARGVGYGSRPRSEIPRDADNLFYTIFAPGPGATQVRIDVGVGLDGAWELLGVLDGREPNAAVTLPGAVIQPAREEDGKTLVTVSHQLPDRTVRLVAVDRNGFVRQPGKFSDGRRDDGGMYEATFELPLAAIQEVRLETQKLAWATFENVSLRRGQKTEVQAAIRSKGSADASAHEVVLPKLDKQPVVLDLATGELIPLPPVGPEPGKILRVFREMGKGDLLYDVDLGDRALIFLRDAVSSPPGEDTGEPSVTGHLIKNLPETILVVTKEGRGYDVTILAADENGCTLKYSLLPAGVFELAPEMPSSTVTPDSKSITTTLPNGVTASLLGLFKGFSRDNQSWWYPDGTPIPPERSSQLRKNVGGFSPLKPWEQFDYGYLVQFNAVEGMTAWADVKAREQCFGFGSRGDSTRNYNGFAWQSRRQDVGDIRIASAIGPYRTVETDFAAIRGERTRLQDESARFLLSVDSQTSPKWTAIDVVAESGDYDVRLRCLDADGRVLPAHGPQTGPLFADYRAGDLQYRVHEASSFASVGTTTPTAYYFQISTESTPIKRVLVDYRPSLGATFRNVALRPGQKTEVQIETGSKGPADTAVREGDLPNMGKRPVILDLATGELVPLLPVGPEPQKTQQALRESGKGDILYRIDLGDRTLIFLRDARSEPPADETGDPSVTGHLIKNPPETITVITKEGRRYKVTILAADENSCTMKYSPIPPDRSVSGGAPVEPKFDYNVVTKWEDIPPHVMDEIRRAAEEGPGVVQGDFERFPERLGVEGKRGFPRAPGGSPFSQYLDSDEARADSDGGASVEPEKTGGPLEFRIAPQAVDLSGDAIEKYKQALAGGESLAGGDFAWFEVRPGIRLVPDQIECRHDGKTYLLLWDEMSHRMLADGTWGLKQVRESADAVGRAGIEVTLDGRGAQRLRSFAQAHLRQYMAILVEGRVIAIPFISASLTLPEGRLPINGQFTEQEIKDFIAVLLASIRQESAEPNAARTPRADGPGSLGRYALSFDGVDDCLLVPASPSLAIEPPFTIEMWLKPEPAEESYDPMILMQQGHKPDDPKKFQAGGFLIWGGRSNVTGVPGTSSLFLGQPEGGCVQRNMTMSPPLDQPGWAYLCTRYDGADYVSAENEPLRIGADFVPKDVEAADHPQSLRGRIAEIRIWNKALTEAESRYSRSSSLTGSEPNLVACWTFEEGSGQIVHDISPNANHARLGSSVDADDADPAWTDLRTTSVAPSELSGRVVDPNGLGVVGAQVAVVTAKAGVTLDGCRLEAGPHEGSEEVQFVTTYAGGQFSLKSEPNESSFLIASHERGFAKIGADRFAANREIRLEPWGRVEGQLAQGRRALDDRVQMGMTAPANASQRVLECGYSHGTRCDSEGRFAFRNVPPGRFEIGYSIKTSDSSNSLTSRTPVMVRPGEATRVRLGGEGRPIVGRFVPPSDQGGTFHFGRGQYDLKTREPSRPRPPDYAQMTDRQQQEWLQRWWRSEEAAAYFEAIWRDPNRRGYAFDIKDDGSFRIEDVISGEYDLVVSLEEQLPGQGPPEEIGLYRGAVKVPAMTESYTEEPLDLGDLTLSVRNPLHVGDPAPLFEARSVDGNDIRLIDCRGKFVLLSFWCPSYHPELDVLKRLHTIYADTGKLWIIGFGSDTPEEIGKYATEQRIEWPEICIGTNWDEGIAEEYRLAGVPYIVLVDPEGKIAATRLRGEELTKTVREAIDAPVRP